MRDEYAASPNPLNWMRCGGGDGVADGDGEGDGEPDGATDGFIGADDVPGMGDIAGAGDGDDWAWAARVPAIAISMNATSESSFFKIFPSAKGTLARMPSAIRAACKVEDRTA